MRADRGGGKRVSFAEELNLCMVCYHLVYVYSAKQEVEANIHVVSCGLLDVVHTAALAIAMPAPIGSGSQGTSSWWTRGSSRGLRPHARHRHRPRSAAAQTPTASSMDSALRVCATAM